MKRNPELNLAAPADLNGRLDRHPAVKARVARMLDLLENTGGDVKRADEAERRVIDELRAMGKELLCDWGQGVADEESKRLLKMGGVVRQVKKTALAKHVR